VRLTRRPLSVVEAYVYGPKGWEWVDKPSKAKPTPAPPKTKSGNVANTIMAQIKQSMSVFDYLAMGIKKGSVYSIGATTKLTGSTSTGAGVQFDVRGHWKGRVIVRLAPSDTYTIIFGRDRRRKDKKLGVWEKYWYVDEELTGIYADMLGKIMRDYVLGTKIKK
jgi:hypothetical protein